MFADIYDGFHECIFMYHVLHLFRDLTIKGCPENSYVYKLSSV